MGLPQTSVTTTPARGVPGTLARVAPKAVVKRRATGICYPGRWVNFTGEECAHPTAADDNPGQGGVVLKNDYSEDGSWPDNTMVDVLTEGFVLVQPENAVTADAQAFARFNAPSTENLGDFRSDAGDDGTNGGIDITVDTAVNDEGYRVTLDKIDFSVDSGAGATTTSIATALFNEINAHPDYTATNPSAGVVRVVKTASATAEIAVSAIDSRMSYVKNGKSFAVPGAVYRTTGSGVTELQVGVR